MLKEILPILFGALIAILGGFIQKRFDIELDKKENDIIIFANINKLLQDFLGAKASFGDRTLRSKKILELQKDIMKTAFLIRSKKHKNLKIDILEFITNDFKIENLEKLQEKLEKPLMNN